MTIKELIDEIDEQKPNTYALAYKLRWLSVIERKIIDSVIMTHEFPADTKETLADFERYTESDYNNRKQLLADDAYCDLYKYYIYAMIDATNGETKRYEGSMQLHNMMLKDYMDLVNRNVMPVQIPMRY